MLTVLSSVRDSRPSKMIRDGVPTCLERSDRDYGLDLEDNLQDLHARVHRGAYRARPTRRVFIPKPDGRLRPLGVAALEDKILQRAVVEVLNAIYEADFLGCASRVGGGRLS